MKQDPKSQVIANKKKELYQKSMHYRSAVTSDLNHLKFDLGWIGKNVLFIGGSLYVAYKLAKLIGGGSSSRGQEETKKSSQKMVRVNESSPMVLKIKEQIALFLLALAFKKLKEFVKENGDKNDAEEDS